MRTLVLSAFAAFALLASAARAADDNKPPSISDVKASAKGGKVQVEARITDETGVLSATVHHRTAGGKVEDTPMQKNDYDDVFKASFAGTGDTEYWIDSTDLLGNGPATYGSSNKAFTASGKAGKGGGTSVATKEPPPQREPPAQREPPPPTEEPAKQEPPAEPPPRREPREPRPPRPTAKVAEPPVIEHRKPSIQPPEGRDFIVRMKIKSESPLGVEVLMQRQQGATAFSSIKLSHTEGDSYEAVIPGTLAKGTIEYLIAAKNEAGMATQQGDGDKKTPYTITFKPSSGSSSGSQTVAAAEKPSGPYQFTHLPLYRVPPGKPVVVRAQIVPSADSGDVPDHVALLWRGNDAQDQFTEMVADPTGGYGGFRAELPQQEEGAIFYQIIACDQSTTHCGGDTGSKRKWHAAAVSAQPGAAQPMALDAVSTKAPAALPE